eukprot:4614478-Pleurochrysis_carterae.AAC.1
MQARKRTCVGRAPPGARARSLPSRPRQRARELRTSGARRETRGARCLERGGGHMRNESGRRKRGEVGERGFRRRTGCVETAKMCVGDVKGRRR